MRKILISIILGFSTFLCFSQTKDDMKAEILQLKSKIEIFDSLLIEANNKVLILETRLQSIAAIAQQGDIKIDSTKSNTTFLEKQVQNKDDKISADKRCKAITATGNQCSRNASADSDYCWQHAKSEVNKKTSTTTSTSSSSTSTTNNGRKIYTGSRGGQYYINSNGNKTYIKK